MMSERASAKINLHLHVVGRRPDGYHLLDSLVVEKTLPVASGIGGGSADAAATLRLLSRFWGVDARQEALAAIAARLGADVPVCLAGRAAVESSLGEILAPEPPLPLAGM